MSNLYVLVGIPGCGKSSWAATRSISVVSRDSIRFKMLKKGEDYFAHEDEVFKTFVSNIKESLMNGKDVIADATHLNEASRSKLLSAVKPRRKADNIIAVYFDVPTHICQDRNAKRTGRSRVPKKQIANMATHLTKPTFNEKFHYSEIWTIDKDGNVTKDKDV